MIYPKNFAKKKLLHILITRLKTIINISQHLRCCTGGPHIQYVSNSWRMTVDMRAQNLSRQGFVVLKVCAYAAVLTLAVGS